MERPEGKLGLDTWERADVRRAIEGGPGCGGHTWRASFWHRWGWKAKWDHVKEAGQEARGPVERQRP